jgi:hypothetical protein
MAASKAYGALPANMHVSTFARRDHHNHREATARRAKLHDLSSASLHVAEAQS